MSKTSIPNQDQRQAPWNKGRLIGQKRPLKPKEVWNIRARLQIDVRRRDLAMFNLAIDSKLRGCDLVRLKIDDLCVGGRLRDRATIIQKKATSPHSGRRCRYRRAESDCDRLAGLTGTIVGEFLLVGGHKIVISKQGLAQVTLDADFSCEEAAWPAALAFSMGCTQSRPIAAACDGRRRSNYEERARL